MVARWQRIWPTGPTVALERLKDACRVSLPSFRESDWLQFQTDGRISYDTIGIRIDPVRCRRSFFAYCSTIDERVIVAIVETCIRNIGLETGIPAAIPYRQSAYEIPVAGVRHTTHVDVTIHRSKADFSGSFCRIVLS
jgi:hypothetical protein